MKVPISWLRDYIEIDSVDTLDKTLTLAGLEVDKIEKVGDDTVLEISLTPNLGHCMSIFGIARELSAHLKKPLKKPEAHFTENGELNISVDVQDKTNTPRYSCRTLFGTKVGPSPEWLVKRLELCGINSINNLVDIANYVMLEFGQPLHIFDYDTIQGKKIHVASHTPYTSILALDDITYKIDKDTLLICDAKEPLAIAGIIGGKNSAVSPTTKNILIESAYFTKESIRKTSKRLGLRTDASARFEKTVDPDGVIFALDRAVTLIQKFAGGTASKGLIDEKVHPFMPKAIVVRQKKVNHILGTHLSLNEIGACLERLEMQIKVLNDESLTAFVPTYRNDITTEIDLIEEVARVYGYNNIPKKIPYFTSSKIGSSPIYLFENTVKRELIAQGLQEFLTCDLISETQSHLCLERGMTKQNLIHVLQPSNIDQSILRASMLPGLMTAVKYNIDHQNPSIFAFEIGKIHFKDKEKYSEHSSAGIILTGNRAPHYFDPKPSEVDFFDLKGIVENLLSQVSNEKPRFDISHFHHFHPQRQARILYNDCQIGVLGEIHPKELKLLGIDQRVYFAELNVSELQLHKKEDVKVKELPLFPSSVRDWTVTLTEEVPISYVINAIEEQKSPLLEKIMLLDLYKSEQIGKDRRNITLRFVYRDSKKTISFETVEKEHADIIIKVKNKIPSI